MKARTNEKLLIDIFQSMIQPLRQAKQEKNGLSAKDLELEVDRRAIVTPKARFPKKSNQCTDEWMMKKYEELKRVEEKNLEMISGIWVIFSQKGFQELFNPVEKTLLQKICQFMHFYIRTYKFFVQDGGEKSVIPVDKIKNLYEKEYLILQEKMVSFLLELFALAQLFRTPRMRNKIEDYFKSERQSMGGSRSVAGADFDPRDFILSGKGADIVIMAVQKVNRRALLLREIIEHMDEGSEEEIKLKEIYEQAEKVNLFANEVMRKTDKRTTHINCDPFCLREQLAEDEAYAVIAEMAKGRGREMRRALRFLREIGILARKNHFAMGGFEDKMAVSAFALKYMGAREVKACMQWGKHEVLMETLMFKVQKDLELVEPILRQFVGSEYFITRASLQLLARETEGQYQSRLENRVSRGSECIELFLIEKEDRKQLEQRRLNPNPSATSIRDKKNKASSALKALAWIAPFLILTAIPFVGIFFPLIGFIVLGSARLLYCLVECMEEDKIKYRENEGLILNKRIAVNDSVNGKPENSRKNQHISISKRRAAEKLPLDNADEANKEVLIMPSYLADRKRPGSAIRRHSGLGAGRWLEEDRERREKGDENDAFGMQNPISGSESEITSLSWFREDSESEMSYESFSEVELNSDEDEEVFISPIQSRKFGVGK